MSEGIQARYSNYEPFGKNRLQHLNLFSIILLAVLPKLQRWTVKKVEGHDGRDSSMTRIVEVDDGYCRK